MEFWEWGGNISFLNPLREPAVIWASFWEHFAVGQLPFWVHTRVLHCSTFFLCAYYLTNL
jgi:hypothetical protein